LISLQDPPCFAYSRALWTPNRTILDDPYMIEEISIALLVTRDSLRIFDLCSCQCWSVREYLFANESLMESLGARALK
jgi:hypothetical protein